MRRKKRTSTLRLLCFALSVVGLFTIYSLRGSEGSQYSRKLLQTESEITPTSEDDEETKGEYPDDLFSEDQLKNGAFLLHTFGIIYMNIGLAIICDDFFVPTLEVIIEKFEISADVAGATLMAAGGSAPELFTSFLGVFIAHSQIGFGTIVGSAVFNVLFVIGACAFCSKSLLELTWWPLARDSTFYAIDLVVLVVFFMDGQIRWWESVTLFLLYLCYVRFMKYNAGAEAYVTGVLENFGLINQEVVNRRGSREGDMEMAPIDGGGSSTPRKLSVELRRRASSGTLAENAEALLAEAEEEEGESSLLWKILATPYELLFSLTVPNPQSESGKRFFVVTFFMSILWLGILSYNMVWWATTVADTLGIPVEIMGLTVLAVATSVPDLLSSVYVARQGLGDMAVSSSIGSNIFDVTVGLPLPWMIWTFSHDLESYEIDSKGLFISVIVLLLMLVAVIVSIAYCDWKMSKNLGILMFVLYILFVTQSLLTEYLA